MKRLLSTLLPVGMLVALVPGCGYYTNIPAQLTLLSVTPGRVSYNSTDKSVEVQDPQAVLRADPGSIGATFNRIDIAYYDSARNPLPTSTLPAISLGMTLHVDSSAYPSNVNDPTKPIVQADLGSAIAVQQQTFTLPVITRLVEQYGASHNASSIWAECKLIGGDDALFDSTQDFFVPIVFSGLPTTTGS